MLDNKDVSINFTQNRMLIIEVTVNVRDVLKKH